MAQAIKTVSEFLSELDPWSILDSTEYKKAFKEETGIEPEWPDYSHSIMLARIRSRGKGGELHGPGKAKLRYVGALDVAEWFARKFLGPEYRHSKFGMGSGFRTCVGDLKNAGY